MEKITLPIILQLIGIFVIIAEIIIPSGGLLSLIAIGIFAYSFFLIFAISVSAGVMVVIADVILLPILVIVGLKLLAKSPVTLRQTLARSEGVISQSSELDTYIHQQGKAITDLRPSGMAMINSKRVDVVSRGEYIEKGAEIYVSAVKGNQIIVRKNEELEIRNEE